jgi:hypothetical protein
MNRLFSLDLVRGLLDVVPVYQSALILVYMFHNARRRTRLSRKVQYSVDVLYEALLVLALCVDRGRSGVFDLLAAHGEESAADCYTECCHCELYMT